MADALLTSSHGEASTRLARRSIQQNYLDRCLQGITFMFQCVSNMESNSGTTVNTTHIARLYINCILDDTIRHLLLTEFDKKLKEIRDTNSTLAERIYIVNMLAIDMIGEVNSYFDEYFSVHTGQEIGEV